MPLTLALLSSALPIPGRAMGSVFATHLILKPLLQCLELLLLGLKLLSVHWRWRVGQAPQLVLNLWVERLGSGIELDNARFYEPLRGAKTGQRTLCCSPPAARVGVVYPPLSA